jgi:non-ribosomal peptide synthetase component E (peptide arylation enzyme)
MAFVDPSTTAPIRVCAADAERDQRRAAAALAQRGLRIGDRVAVNVYPVEVERALLEHPDVREAAVFAVEDEEWGEQVCAAIVGDVDPAALGTWLRERLAPHKRPKRVVPVDEIPVSPTGKVRRSLLGTNLGLA